MLVQEVLEAKRNVRLWTTKEAEAKEVLRQFDRQQEEAKLKQLEMELREEKAQKEALRRSNWIKEQQRIIELEKQLDLGIGDRCKFLSTEKTTHQSQ